MRLLAYVIAWICAASFCLAAPQPGNRIQNGGITEVEGDKPAQWGTYVAGGDAPLFTVEEAGAREKVLRLEATHEKTRGFWVSPGFPVTPGERLTVSAAMRSALTKGSAMLSIGFRGGDGLAFGIRDLAHLTGTAEWETRAQSVEVPAGAKSGYLTLGVGPGTTGTIWGDDFAVVACPLRISLKESGLKAAEGRVLGFSLEATGDLPEKIRVELRLDGAGKLEERVLETAGKRRFDIAFRTDRVDAIQIAAHVFSPEGLLLAADTLEAPPVMEASLGKASYRNTLFVTKESPRVLEASVTLHAEPAALRGLALRAALLAPDNATPLATHEARVTGNRVPFRLELSRVPNGRYQLQLALVSGGKPVAQAELPFAIREDGPNTVRIDEHLNLVIGGKPFFPHGVYGGAPPEQLPNIKAGGFNTLFAYDSNPEALRKLLDKAQEVGLRVMVSAAVPFAGKLPAEREKLREVVLGLKDHPALLGWYLYDEPDGQGIAPSIIRDLHEAVSEFDPDHPTWVVFDKPDAFHHYAGVSDLFMIDPYPLLATRHPLTKVSDWMETAHAAVKRRQPVIAVPQAFGWDVVANVPKVSYQTPTPEEYRAMAYLALAHDARGLAPYCYHVYTEYDASKKGWPWKLGGYLPDKQPALWGSMTAVAREVNALASALLCADRQPFVEGAIHGIRLRPAGGKETVILVNPGEEPAPIPAGLRRKMRVIIPEGAGAPPETLQRYGVLVMERAG